MVNLKKNKRQSKDGWKGNKNSLSRLDKANIKPDYGNEFFAPKSLNFAFHPFIDNLSRAKTVRTFLCSLVLLPFLWSCETIIDTVHEFPEIVPEPVRVEIRFHFVDDPAHLYDYKTIDYLPSRGAQAINVEEFTLRYSLKIEDKTGKVIRMDSVTNGFQDGAVSFSVDLPLNTEYRTTAWVEWVDAASPHTDLFYNLQLLDYVQPKAESLVGASNDKKDAFMGASDFTTDEQGIIKEGDRKIVRDTVNLIRPLAKFKVQATDLDDYFAENGPLPVSARLIYVEGVPLSYFPRQRDWVGDTDYFTATGLVNTFTREECTLAFDWVFALDTETTVPVRVEVYDENNNLIARSPRIEVPLLRNALTIVKGPFLSVDDHGSGMGIDDRFEEEIIIDF